MDSEQPPAYRQQPPAHGQQPPAYGQQPPAFGQPPVAPPLPPAPYGQAPSGPAPYGQAPYGQAAAAGTTRLPELAHWGLRVGAWVIDALLAYAVLMVAAVISLATSTTGVDSFGTPTTSPTALGTILVILGYGAAIGIWIWNRVLTQGRTGQTVGKRALKIRLMLESTGQPVGPGLALGRDVAHIVDGIGDIGFLWPLWDPKKQTFADKICSTVVVRA